MGLPQHVPVVSLGRSGDGPLRCQVVAPRRRRWTMRGPEWYAPAMVSRPVSIRHELPAAGAKGTRNEKQRS